MKIRLKMVNGEEYTLSHEVYGGSEPLNQRSAGIQIGFILTDIAYFNSDQGDVVSARHIVSARVEE